MGWFDGIEKYVEGIQEATKSIVKIGDYMNEFSQQIQNRTKELSQFNEDENPIPKTGTTISNNFAKDIEYFQIKPKKRLRNLLRIFQKDMMGLLGL